MINDISPKCQHDTLLKMSRTMTSFIKCTVYSTAILMLFLHINNHADKKEHRCSFFPTITRHKDSNVQELVQVLCK